MRAMMAGFAVALAVLAAGCFPDPPQKDGDDASDTGGGLDTSIAGDTGPQGDADATAPEDTADTALADAVDAEDTAADTLVADTADTADAADGDTTPPECTSPAECQHLAGTCVKVLCLAGSCAAQPDTGNACDDGQACTKGDTCQGFSCVGTAYACDDGVSCTDDVCTGDGGCSYPAKEGFCHIGGACVVAGKVKEDDPCRVCVAGDAWSPNDGASCEDGDPVCTLGDTCDGTECVGGDPPDDSAGDWAMNVVASVSPQQSGVLAITQAGLAHWIIAASARGGGSAVTSTQTVTLPAGDNLVMVRRTASSSFVDSSFTGFQSASLRTLGARAGWYVAAISTRGAGVVTSPQGSADIADTGEAQNHVLAVDPLGQTSYLRVIDHEIADLTVATDGGVTAVGAQAAAIDVPELGLHYLSSVVGDAIGVVAAYDGQGRGRWGGIILTGQRLPLSPKICRVADGSLLAFFSIPGAAELRFPNAEPSTLASPDAAPAFAMLHLAPDGTLLAATTPTTFQDDAAWGTDKLVISCVADGVIVGVRGREPVLPGEHLNLHPGRSTLARVDVDGTVRWSVTSSAASLSLAAGGSRVVGFVATTIGSATAPAPDFVAADGSPMHDGVAGHSSALFELTLDGELTWYAPLPATTASLVTAVALPASGRGVALAGAFVGQSGDVSPDGRLHLTGQADFNAFAAYLNSADGLTCSYSD